MAKRVKDDPNQPALIKQEIPKMPEGYYSGDKPNPNLRAFVEEHIKDRPYDPQNDDYNVPAFDKPITTTKATAIYNMHTYWSKKPHDAIREYIKHYTKPGDLVLDPFCGSGGTALAALMENRKAIAIDRSPAATFITKNYCTPVDTDDLEKSFAELNTQVMSEIDWLYETKCDRCGGKAITSYIVYSQVFQCPRCLEKVALYDCVEIQDKTHEGKEKYIMVCPSCFQKGIEEVIDTRSKKYGSIPVLVNYFCENGCKPKKGERRHNDNDKKKREYFNKYDLGKIEEIDKKEIPYWHPQDRMMHAPDDQECWGVKWRAGTSNFRSVDELFTKRNLWALSIMLSYIKQIDDPTLRGAIEFCWSSVLLNLSRMTTDRDRLGFLKGTYYIPQNYRCTNVLNTIANKFRMMIPGWDSISKISTSKLNISTEDATSLTIPSNSIDYIFTDPPYADKEQYGELNFIWEAWLGFDTYWHDDEIIINNVRGKTEDDWARMMKSAINECFRILKPGRWLSLCYHDTSEGTWSLIQDIMTESGFIPDQTNLALFIDTSQKSYNQKVADKVNKRDLVINFRKPYPNELSDNILIDGTESTHTFNEKAHKIIHDYLSTHPGSSKDRIYDELVSRMVRTGSMETHNFEELLRQLADEVREPIKKNLFENRDPNLFGTHEISRWYLKETELDISDTAESAKEDAAAEVMGSYIQKNLKKNKGYEGVHYSDIFENYIYSVKDKPRRQLSDWLLDYFYKTDEGTYRLPASEEEKQLKADGRSKGTLRRVRRYIAFLEQGVAIPDHERPNDATLAEWIRHCKRSGLYAQGKLLYEKGGINIDSLPEELMVGVEEDYQVCARMLSREGDKKAKKSQ